MGTPILNTAGHILSCAPLFFRYKRYPLVSMTDTLSPPFGVKSCMSYTEAQVLRDIVLDIKPTWLALENDWWQFVSNGTWAPVPWGKVVYALLHFLHFLEKVLCQAWRQRVPYESGWWAGDESRLHRSQSNNTACPLYLCPFWVPPRCSVVCVKVSLHW